MSLEIQKWKNRKLLGGKQMTGSNVGRNSAFWLVTCLGLVLSACGGGSGTTTTPPPTTYVLTVNSTTPASGVAITVAPADNNGAANGSTSFTRTYNSGASVTLTAPATAGGNGFSSWTGCTTASTTTCTVTMNAGKTVTAGYTAPVILTPTVTVTPASSAISTTQALSVTIAVSGGSGNPTPTGTVTLASGSYTSAATALSSGSATISIPAGSLATGSDTLTATYTPDTASSATYASATGTAPVTVIVTTAVAVDQLSMGPEVTDQLLGMNLAVWYDLPTNATAILNAFQAAGIKAVRWPGGSDSDLYHWATHTLCDGGYASPNDTFANFVNDFAIPSGEDVALTANYGSNSTCTGGGDPSEAAAWATAALNDGITVSHMTVGNEEYGSWEYDLHASKNDPTTYAAAVVGANGYYSLIKAASPATQVGVVVEADNTTGGWDNTVLANAKGSYDFVELHYYPEAPGSENDTALVQQLAQGLTTDINIVKAELTKWGTPNTPIYIGEMGSVFSDPGKQSWSITQGLYAGQMLGEMMNDGVARATWWIGFGNCNGNNGNVSSSLYGWQNFGAYNIFADGSGDTGGTNNSPCNYNNGPIGSMSPTARAYQLFSKIAVDGEFVLTSSVTGDPTDIRAYAATNNGGTALFLFNLNKTTSLPITISLSSQSASTDVTMETYDKSIYDQSQGGVWAAPTSTDLGAQNLPLSLTLTPWSMNVIIIK
ncbi:MAG TPA: hypothetical protein VFU55_08040 [Terracidiphilus sp.]|nr:hypothetical protein [Terracidiphilus sp.]